MYGLGVGSLLILTTVVWYFSSIPKNLRDARKTGLPILIRPILHTNVFWIVFVATFQPQLKRWLPKPIWDYFSVIVTGWEFHEKWKIFERVGATSFIIVTPGGNEIWTADPAMASQVLLRRKDFLQLELSSRKHLLSILFAVFDWREICILRFQA